ncbi:hypothetical protein [Bradyrhizobium sp.]|uniref:hypothetical protein n=1 Tax=Bradyrhizobium sp. TaxID=376 RepID=UPI00403785E2
MTQKAGILIGSILIALLAVVTATGIALFIIASRMPAHTDEQRATELTLQYLEKYSERSPEEREKAKDQIVPLRTSKWQLHTAGLSMSLLGSSLLFGMLFFKLWDIRKLRSATTPQTRPTLLAIAGAAWLALLPAFALRIGDELAQDDLTPTMDSGVGSFMSFLPPFLVTTLIVLMVLGRYVILRNARLPANLWIWNTGQPYRSLIWTIFYGLLASILIVLVVMAAWGAPWGLPSLMVALYVVLSTRAAVVSGGYPSAGDTNYKSTTT